MILKPHSLTGQLKKNLKPFYWVSSDEFFLNEETENIIQQFCIKSGYTEKTILTINQDFSTENFYTQTHSISLFAEKKILIIRSNKSIDAKLGKLFFEYLNNPNPDLILILNTGKQSSPHPKWLKQFIDHSECIFIQHWPIEPHELPHFIQNRLKALKLNISHHSIQQLASHYEGNLPALNQALNHLQTISNNPTESQIEQLLSSQAQYPIFKITEALLRGEKSRYFQMIDYLEHHNPNDLMGFMGYTAKLLRTLAILKSDSKTSSLNQLFKQHRIWPKQQAVFQTALNLYSEDQIWNLILKLSQCDAAAKGLGNINVYSLLKKIL